MKHNDVTTVNFAPAFQKGSISEDGIDYKSSPAWKSVERARAKGRKTTLEYIDLLFSDFLECHGDRNYADDAAIVGGIALLGDQPVTVIGHQKGRDVSENLLRNFGMPHPEGYRKALRLMKQAEKFRRPIICFIDTPGAYCGLGAEERGQGEAIAQNLMQMASLKVPVISIVIGEGGSGGALALGVCNHLIMLENSVYSVLSPEGFASILWKDASRAAEAANLMKITAKDLFSFGIVDQIIHEKNDCLEKLSISLRQTVQDAMKLDAEALIAQRRGKFRKIGL